MATNPTYAVEHLKEAIPIANLDNIKEISISLRNEQSLYPPLEYTKILTLLTRRLIELSNLIY